MFVNSFKKSTPPPENFKLSTIKRLITCIAFLIFIFSCIFLTACSSQDDNIEYESIPITKENYADYIAINMYYTDCNAYLSDKTNDNFTYYKMYCIGHIETSRKQDCYFNNVTITFSVQPETLWQAYMSDSPTSNLDYQGYSHCSFTIEYRSDSFQIYFPDSNPENIGIKSITGTVFVRKGKFA